jgi:hypothetical protein
MGGIQEKEAIFYFDDEYKLELDTTRMSAVETARRTREHVHAIIRPWLGSSESQVGAEERSEYVPGLR